MHCISEKNKVERHINTHPTGGTYLVCEWLLELVDLQGRDEGDVVKAVVRRRLLLQLLRQIAAQLHHGCRKNARTDLESRDGRTGSGRRRLCVLNSSSCQNMEKGGGTKGIGNKYF